MKHNKFINIFLISIAIIGFIFFLSSVNKIIAQSSSSIDFFSPGNDEIIYGKYQIRWYMDIQPESSVEYEINLYQGRCWDESRKYVGQITKNEIQSDGAEKFYSYLWDTTSTLINNVSVEDGEYCLVLDFYNIGNERNPVEVFANIEINNTINSPPYFKTMQEDIFIEVGNSIILDTDAEDIESDDIKYELLVKPDFLTINKNTGVISSRNKVSTPGNFPVVMIARDSKGASSQMVFYINVFQDVKNESSNFVSFITPRLNTVYHQGFNTIEWQFQDMSNVKKGELFYSINGQDWKKLIDINKNSTKYSFDISNLKKDSYYFKIEIQDVKNNLYVKVSPKIFIAQVENTNIRSIPVISDTFPEEDSQIQDANTPIFGSFLPSVDAEIFPENIHIFLNETDISDKCTFIENEFECRLTDRLQSGGHKVAVEIIDSKASIYTKEWIFSVVEVSPIETNEPVYIPDEVVEVFGLELSRGSFILLIVILCLFGVSIIVPWVIFSLWFRRPVISKTIYTPQFNPSDDYNDYSPSEPGQYIPSPQPQPQQTQSAVSDAEGKYDIGTQSIGDEVSYPASQAPVQSENDQKISAYPAPVEPSLPSSYSEDVPDWLKDPDAPLPVDIKGEEIEHIHDDKFKPLEGTEPYGYKEYGKGGKV